ncbi:MAG: RsmD family RNA methyltransferase [Lentisphaeria bacterium]|nr:RsmD family RNA methyltransferase [Lentisphaeria bacterium]
MRIIGGRAGGIHLRVPPGDRVRPTADRVKEALFASLGTIEGRVVADLFSGTGALGLEALSRGARTVLLVERDRAALAVLRQNAARVLQAMDERGDALRILAADVARLPRLLADWAGTVDLILADPPYHPAPRDYGAPDLLRDPSFAEWARAADLVLEHAVGTALPWFPEGAWFPQRQKRFGDLMVSFAQQRRQNAGPIDAARRTEEPQPLRTKDADTRTIPPGHAMNRTPERPDLRCRFRGDYPARRLPRLPAAAPSCPFCLPVLAWGQPGAMVNDH